MTATDLIMAVMQEFSTAEAKSILVIWCDESGDICIASNCSDVETIGMAEYAKSRSLLRQLKLEHLRDGN
jgi:hypothetical protein